MITGMNLCGSCLHFSIWKSVWDGATWNVYLETWIHLTYLQISAQNHDIWQNLCDVLSRRWNLQFHQQELAQGLPWFPSAISIFSSINIPVCSAQVKTVQSSVTQSSHPFIQALFECSVWPYVRCVFMPFIFSLWNSEGPLSSRPTSWTVMTISIPQRNSVLYEKLFIREKNKNSVKRNDEGSTLILGKKNQYLIVEEDWETTGTFRKIAYVNRIR